ncbi:hypothetical protein GE061_011034 [Apolygus lucorum]|uniref:THAP-type domain-containing protein n=1 Tax=Apolygus lucorum TaxID=248454 RepID=A0A8S9Y0D1_APOLU|nr:hypothetical protein GE061_011034 [Apolygus lucorum]
MTNKSETFQKFVKPQCTVLGCKNEMKNRRTGPSFHHFPNRDKYPNEFNEWVKATGRPSSYFSIHEFVKSLVVCGEHFTSKDFELFGRKIGLSPKAIPNRRLPSSEYNVPFVPEVEDVGNGQPAAKRIREDNNVVHKTVPSIPIISEPQKQPQLKSFPRVLVVSSLQPYESAKTQTTTVKQYKPSKCKTISNTNVTNKENVNKDSITCVLDLPTSDAAHALQEYRDIYRIKQKKTKKS